MKKIIPSLIIVTVAGIATATMIVTKQSPATRSPNETGVLVNTMTAEARDVTFNIESQGIVQPRTETTIVTEVAGLVTSVSDKFVVGGFFNEGDILLTLDPVDYEVALEQARANLLTAQAQLTQQAAQAEQAGKEWDLSGKSRESAPILALRTPYLKEAQARVLYAQAELKRAQRKLDRTVIRAPYTGLVREKLVDVGHFAGMGARIAETFAVDIAEVRLPLSDRDLAFLNLPGPGQRQVPGSETTNVSHEIAVTLDATVGGRQYQWPARIERTEGVVDTNSRMVYAIAEVLDPYGLLDSDSRPPLAIGTFVNARLEGISAHGLYPVPHGVLSDGMILVMDDEQRLRHREVTIIRRDSEFSWVSEGINELDEIVTTSLDVPVEGMKLERYPDSL